MDLTGQGLRRRREEHGLSQAKLSELSGVPQHRLSAFELGKVHLPDEMLGAVYTAIARTATVLSLAQREKRYREHEYAEAPRTPDRVARVQLTAGNPEYRRALDRLLTAHSGKELPSLSALSLFSGCGGFSLGFSAAGFAIKGFLEIDPRLRHIYRDNFPQPAELGGDIAEMTEPVLSAAAETLGQVDVILGGPPCQGFSLAGKRLVADPRNLLFKHYLRVVDAFRPKIAIMENVRLLTSMKTSTGGLLRDQILREFNLHGYKSRVFEIDATDYGVPQHRERVLFVAVRSDLDLVPSIPAPTHGRRADLFSGVEPIRTFADACSDLAYLESGEKSADPLHAAVRHPKHVIDWLWDVKEGHSAHANLDPASRPPSGYNTTYKRQVWHEPASTVQTTFGMISGCRNVHPIATRSLTIREAARIQSFPDTFVFKGSLGTIRQGIGNAVPPLLAYSLALHARAQILDLVKIAGL